MFKLSILVLCIVFFLQSQDITVISSKDVIDDYNKFLAGRDVYSLTEYSGTHSRRDVVELVLIQQALKRGGVEGFVRFIASPTYNRSFNLIDDGEVLLIGNSVWNIDLQKRKENVYITIPVIKNGEFEAGIFTIPSNRNALAVTDKQGVQGLSAVSSRSWVPDWRTLEALGLKELHHASRIKPMVNMVSHGRVDFTLAPFSGNSDFSVMIEGVKLVPIQGIKVGLIGSRHFCISKKHPQGLFIYNALNKGLKEMDEQGIIRKIYRDCGFFNERVESWKKIN